MYTTKISGKTEEKKKICSAGFCWKLQHMFLVWILAPPQKCTQKITEKLTAFLWKILFSKNIFTTFSACFYAFGALGLSFNFSNRQSRRALSGLRCCVQFAFVGISLNRGCRACDHSRSKKKDWGALTRLNLMTLHAVESHRCFTFSSSFCGSFCPLRALNMWQTVRKNTDRWDI